MKKRIIYLVMSVCLLCSISTESRCQSNSEPPIPCNVLPQKPNPATAVNDLANIIDDADQQKMENDIRAYWDSTSIALAVLTVQNMNGKEVSDYALSIFRCWGIGGAGSNRGILFLISMDEHKLWITTGYGIEGILPDVTCHEITENYAKPLCKEEKYSEAVVAGVTQIFKTLGTMSWEERMEGIAAEKAARDRKMADLKEKAINVASVIGILLFVFLLIKIMIKVAKKRRLQRQLVRSIQNIEGEIVKAKDSIKNSLDTYAKEPQWAKEEAGEHSVQAKKNLSEAESYIKKAKLYRIDKPEESREFLYRAHELIEKSFKNFSKIDVSIKNKIQKFAKEAPERLAAALKEVTKSLLSLSRYSDEGWRFSHYISEQEDFKKLLEGYQESLNDPNVQQTIYAESEVIRKKSEEGFVSVRAIVVTKTDIDNRMAHLIANAKLRHQEATSTLKLFNNYKDQYPESVWSADEIRLKKLIAKLETERIEKLKTDIFSLNDMKQQEFSAAAAKFNELNSQVAEIKLLIKKVENIGIEQQNSKKSYFADLNETKILVEKALSKVKDSDVTSKTKSIAKNAKQKLQEANILSSKTILDWIFILQLIESAKDLANSAIQNATSDINGAEEDRAAKARKKRQAESSYNSNSSYGYSGSSYSSDSGSSSFGGFSGGDSGGGGGGSSW